MSEFGLRFNEGKPRWDLVPMDAMEELVQVFTYGSAKYAPRNWENGMPWMACYASLMRHLSDWAQGRDYDGVPGEPDRTHSGLLTMAHVAWNAMALLTFQLRGIGLDDRPVASERPRGSIDLSQIDQEGMISDLVDVFLNTPASSDATSVEELMADFARMIVSYLEAYSNAAGEGEAEAPEVIDANDDPVDEGATGAIDFLSALSSEGGEAIEDLDVSDLGVEIRSPAGAIRHAPGPKVVTAEHAEPDLKVGNSINPSAINAGTNLSDAPSAMTSTEDSGQDAQEAGE